MLELHDNSSGKPDKDPAQWRETATELVRPVSYSLPARPVQIDAAAQKLNLGLTLRKNLRRILLFAFIGAILGVLAVIVQVPAYRAATVIEVLPVNELFMQMAQFDPHAGSYVQNNTYALTQMRLLSTPSQIQRVTERVSLELPPVRPTPAGLFGKIQDRLGLIPREPADFMKMAIDKAGKSVTARILGATRLVEISCESPSADVAAAFANDVTAEYIARNAEFRTSNATRTTEWLQAQVEEAKNRYLQTEAKLQDFLKKQGIDFVLDQSTLADSKLRQLQADLSGIQTDRIAKQTRYEIAKSSPPDAVPEILDDGTLAKLRTQLNDLQRERASLAATLTPEHYKLKRLDAQIAAVESTMQSEKKALLKRIENEYQAALKRERLLSAAYSAQSHSVANQGEHASEFAALKRESDLAKQQYNLLLQQYDQAIVATAVPANNIRVIEQAAPPKLTSRPELASTIVMTSGFCMLLAIAWSLLKEMIRMRNLSRVFAAPGHVTPVLHVPELGVIPTVQAEEPERRWGLRRNRERVNGNGKHGGRELVEWERPSALAESYRNTLASLLARHSEQLMLIVVSPGQGEGKTTLISNLAAATAETGRRVLLVDADLRNPRLHDVFGLEVKSGLADLLESATPVNELRIEDATLPTRNPNLWVLPAGRGTAGAVPSALFSSRLEPLLARLRQMYGVVLIDTPPALAFSDARLLGRFCHGAILVLRSGVTSRQNALLLTQKLAADGIPIAGTILSDWTPDAADEVYYPSGQSANSIA